MLRRPRPSSDREIPPFLDTPAGIVTPSGVHFRTTSALLEEYASEVLETVPLEVLIRRAEIWLRSSQTLALWVLALLLLVAPPWLALGLALLVYLVWEVFSTVLVSRRLAGIFRILEHPVLQGALFVAVLSILGINGELTAVGVGLAAFIGFRWQLIPMVFRPVIRIVRRSVSELPPADQVLRAFVIRAALQHNIRLAQFESVRGPFGGRP